ncbi:hypothetical protein Bca52824_094395 [Brassica carinata]|uniref:Uncharacterized protein n=1 Tax=Brassica carinata TaxID=52824 RepID=A0A8X7P2F1_BRACI|nr:hypothetical protein Bca52824_094395 [Brassica carinata]
MASSTSISLLFLLSFLLLATSRAENASNGSDLDEELAFIAAEESKEQSHVNSHHDQYRDFENYEDLEQGGEFHHGEHEGGEYREEEPQLPIVDEKDVAVLTKDNFTEKKFPKKDNSRKTHNTSLGMQQYYKFPGQSLTLHRHNYAIRMTKLIKRID